MKAPDSAAKKLAKSELPPTSEATHEEGIRPHGRVAKQKSSYQDTPEEQRKDLECKITGGSPPYQLILVNHFTIA